MRWVKARTRTSISLISRRQNQWCCTRERRAFFQKLNYLPQKNTIRHVVCQREAQPLTGIGLVVLRIFTKAVSKVAWTLKLPGKRIDGPVVNILVIEERPAEKRVLSLPSHTERTRVHMLGNPDELR